MAKWLLHWPTPPTKPSSPLKSWAGQDVGASLASLFRLHRDGPGNGRFLGDDPLDQHDLLDLIAIISSVAVVYTHYHCGQGKGDHIPQQDGPISQFHRVPRQASEFEADTAPGKFGLRDCGDCRDSHQEEDKKDQEEILLHLRVTFTTQKCGLQWKRRVNSLYPPAVSQSRISNPLSTATAANAAALRSSR